MSFSTNKTNIVLTVFAVASFGAFRPAASDEYIVTDLGTLGGAWSRAGGVNGVGQVVGASAVYNGAQHAFLWEAGMMYDLGAPPGYLVSSASSVNDSAQVIGTAQGEYQSQYAYLWEDSVWTYLGTLPGDGLDYSATADINNVGQIVGYSFTLGPGSAHRAWIWDDGVMTDLGTLGGEKSSASAINEGGQVVGWAQIDDPAFVIHAFLWEDGVMTDLGTLPDDTDSAASDINNTGQVCGSSSHPVPPYFTARRAVLWDNDTIIDLGLLPGYVKSSASAINDHGQVVGYLAKSLSGSAAAAFIWKDGVMTNLNTLIPPGSGWDLISASDINEAGQIVGYGEIDGEFHGFLLTLIRPGDVNGDGCVDQADLGILLADWACTGGDCPGDCDGDGDTDQADLGILLGNWGAGC